VGARFVLAWRLHRWELAAVAIAAFGLSAWELSVVPELERLLAMCRAATELVAPCGGIREMGIVYSGESQTLLAMVTPLMGALPFAAGVVLGAPLVAREIEHGTALLAWPLARSRARWLWTRLLPVAALGLAFMIVPAMAGEIVMRALFPVLDPGANFEHYGTRGPLLVLRFLPAVTAAALVGAVLGRQLPSLLVAGVVVGAMAIGLALTPPLWLQPEEQPEVFRPIESLGSLYVTVRYRDRNGSWISDEEAFARMFWDGEGPEPDPSQFPEQVTYVIAGERYGEVVVRESALLGSATLALGAVTLAVVRRRRPG
jgi:hypothetical protein